MAAHTVDLMDYAMKDAYASKLESLIPEVARLQKDISYVDADKREGRAFVQPVRLTRAAGWTLSSSGDAFPLNPPEPSQGDDARVEGASFVLRDVISYPAAAKCLKGKRAFVEGTSYLLENMAETASFVLEMQLLHGQRSVGTVDARTVDSGTTQSFSFTAATFIAAMWSGLERGFIDFYTSAGAALTPSGAQITGVDIDTRTIEFLGTELELDAVAAATNPVVYLRGTKEHGMLGLISQVSNTGSMFGINAADYSLWSGNSYASGGALSFAKIMRAMSKPVNRGLMEGVRFYVHPDSWSDCMNDLAALRRYADRAGGKLEQGADELQYHFQNGAVSLVPHILMKPSEAFGLPTKKAIRLGASELTFSLPGGNKGNYWENLPDHAGYGTRCYWHQAVLFPCPAKGVLITGIVNS